MSEIWSSQCAFNLSSWKSNLKKIQAWTGFEPMTLRYRCNRVYHELTIDHLSMWLGSSVDRALHGIARSWVRIPFKPEFFSGCFFNCLSWKHTARIKFHSCFIRSSHIWFSYIHIHIYHYHRVYHELTIDHLSMWLGSSVDRALPGSQGHGFESRSSLNFFFRLLFQLLKLKAHCEDQISLMFHPQFTYMIFMYSYSYISLSSGISRTHIDHLSMWLGSSVDRALHRYRKVMGSNPVQAWIFFRLLFQLLKLKAHCRRSNFTHVSSAVHIYDFHIFIFIYITIIGYITNSQLTIYPCGLVAQWIEHCTGIEGHGFESRSSLNFFRLLFQLLKLKAHCEDQISLMFHPQFTHMIFIYSYSYISLSSGISRTHNWPSIHVAW